MLFLRANTAVTLMIGPFVDANDGVTAEAGLTISQGDVLLSKAGGAFAQKSDANAAANAGNGYYTCAIAAGDANVVGPMRLAVSESGALPVWHDYTVLPAVVYDSIINGNDQLQVHANEITANLITAAAIADGAIDAATFATNAITATVVADNTLTAAKLAANAISAAKLDPDAGTEIAVAVWANGTRALTDKTGFTAAPTAGSIAAASFAANAITADVLADGAIDAATFATNAITSTVVADGTLTAAKLAANAISAAKVDPDVSTEIWAKAGAATTVAMDVLVERIYQILQNRMTANEDDGGIVLRNLANDANIATGSVVSASNTTTRAALSWV